jgi:hypothetical protein
MAVVVHPPVRPPTTIERTGHMSAEINWFELPAADTAKIRAL